MSGLCIVYLIVMTDIVYHPTWVRNRSIIIFLVFFLAAFTHSHQTLTR